MENFIVSARKYRPTTFNSVVGQKSISTTLKNSLKTNHLAHAYLFCGPRGVGKTTSARIFAKTINCQNITDDYEACNECESCIAFNDNRSYNIHELDAASNNSVEDIRTLIEQVRIPPQIGTHSVYIIDEVHMLSAQAFNAFLKTLEEPPEHAIFVLATTEKHKILPTILSRCQIFDFNRIKVEDAVEHLEYVAKSEGIDADKDALNIIAQKADGAMRDALSFFDQIVSFSGKKMTYQDAIENLNVLDYDYYFKLVDYFQESKLSESLLTFNEILSKGFDGHHFITGLSGHFRDLLVCKNPETVELLEVGATIKEKYIEQAKKCDVIFILKALEISNKTDLVYRDAKNKRLQVELALMKLNNITNALIQEAQNKLQQANNQQNTQTNNNTQQQKQVVSNQQNTNTQVSNQQANNVSEKKLVVTESKPVETAKKPIGRRKSRTSGISINSQNNRQQEQKENAVVENLSENFTQEQVNAAWGVLVSSLEKKTPRLYNILKIRTPLITSGTSLELIVSTEPIAEKLNEISAKLVAFLRKRLKNSSVDMKISVGVDENIEQEKRLYSDKDKYEYFAEKNENLNKLKNKLGLDF